MMKNFLFICMLLLGLSTSALAQESIVVTGVVTDTNKEPMIGVNVSISNIPGLGAITDFTNGNAFLCQSTGRKSKQQHAYK